MNDFPLPGRFGAVQFKDYCEGTVQYMSLEVQ